MNDNNANVRVGMVVACVITGRIQNTDWLTVQYHIEEKPYSGIINISQLGFCRAEDRNAAFEDMTIDKVIKAAKVILVEPPSAACLHASVELSVKAHRFDERNKTTRSIDYDRHASEQSMMEFRNLFQQSVDTIMEPTQSTPWWTL